MAALTNATLYVEMGQSQAGFALMTDSGDATTYSIATKPWSRAAGYEPVIAPNGILTGGAVTPAASLANDQVDVAALTAMMAGATGASQTTGVLTVAAANNIAITRGASTNVCCTTAITITAAGAIAAVAGTAAPTASATFGAAGGPPLIPVGSTLVALVSTTSITAAKIQASEISQIYGVSREQSDFPVRTEDGLSGKITFAAANLKCHTGSAARQVYARVATPIFAEQSLARDFSPAERSSSVGTEQYYQGVEGTESVSLAAATWTQAMSNGLTDPILALEGQQVMVKFLPDKNKTAYSLTQGTIRFKTTNAYGKSPSAAVTLVPSLPTVRFAS